MKRLLIVCLLAAALVVSGCFTTYRYSYEPSVKGPSETRYRYHLRSCRTFKNGKELPDYRTVKNRCACEECTVRFNGFTEEGLERLEASMTNVFSSTGIPVDVVEHVNYESSLVSLTSIAHAITLGLMPAWSRSDGCTRMQISVVGGCSNDVSQFVMSEESSVCDSSSGLNLLFPYKHRTDVLLAREGVVSSRAGEREKHAKVSDMLEVYSYAIAATLVKMEREGKIKLTPEAKRRYELRQLYEGGLISEEEYKRETEKLKKENLK